MAKHHIFPKENFTTRALNNAIIGLLSARTKEQPIAGSLGKINRAIVPELCRNNDLLNFVIKHKYKSSFINDEGDLVATGRTSAQINHEALLQHPDVVKRIEYIRKLRESQPHLEFLARTHQATVEERNRAAEQQQPSGSVIARLKKIVGR